MRSHGAWRANVPFSALALTLLTVCVAAGWRMESRAASASHFYASTLAAEDIERTVMIGTDPVTIHEGQPFSSKSPISQRVTYRALRVAYAATLASRSPLFGLAGTDLDELNRQIDELATVQKEVADKQDSEDEKRNILKHLYPTRFLKTLAHTEASRRTFVQTPNERTMDAYNRALQKTIRAYQKDLDSFAVGFEKAAPDSFPLVLLHGTITKDSVRASIQEIHSRIRSASQRLDARLACLSGVIDACDAAELDLPFVMASPQYEVPRSSRALTDEVVSILAEAHPPRVDISTLMSLVALHGSSCAQGFDDPHYFLFAGHAPEKSGVNESLLYVGDLLSYPINPQRPREATFAFLSPTTYYLCPSVGGDISRAAATQMALENKYPDLNTSYKTGTVLDEGEAIRYAYDLLLSPQTSEMGEETLLQFADRGAGFELLVRDVVAQQRAVAREARGGDQTDLSAGWNFLVRSAFTSLFLTHHRTMSPEIQIYAQDRNDVGIDRVLRWSRLRHFMSREEVVQDLREFLAAHRPDTVR